MKTPNQRSFRIIILGAIISMFLIGVGPIEGRVFPVANQYIITSETPEGSDLNIHLIFDKIRDCRPDSIDWYVYFDDKTKDRFNLRFKSPMFSRPLGTFAVNWTIEGAAPYAGHKMEVVNEHHCWGSLLWMTRTVNDVSRNLEASQ
jgi:hypothetical protein